MNVVQKARRDETTTRPDSPDEAASWPSRLAVILLAASWFGQGVGPERAGTPRIARPRTGESLESAKKPR